MYELTQFDSAEEYISCIESHSRGTAFEGLAEVLQENKAAVEFYFSHKEEIIPQTFLGSDVSLYREGVDIDNEKLSELLEQTDTPVSAVHQYIADWNKFLVQTAESVEWDTYIEDFLESQNILPNNRSEAREIFLEDVQRDREWLAENIEQQIEFYESLRGAEEKIDELWDERQDVFEASQKEVYIMARKQDYESSQEMVELHRFKQDNYADVGDYIVYEAHVPNNRDYSQYEFEITPDTVYRVILKVTDKSVREESVDSVPQYETEIIAKNTEINEVWPNHFATREKPIIDPRNQEDITIYSQNPLGSITMKEVQADNPKESYEFNRSPR